MSKALFEKRSLLEKDLLDVADQLEKDGATDELITRSEELKNELGLVARSIEIVKEAADVKAASEARSAITKTDATPAAPAAGSLTVRDISPYAQDAKASWVNDVLNVRTGSDNGEARERLQKHYASENDQQSANITKRTYSSTTTTEGGYLVAPTYLQNDFVARLSAGRVTADLCKSVPLPEKTNSVYIPTANGATAVAVHTENNALTEATATVAQVNAVVKRVGGAASIPMFLLDRSIPGVDQIVMDDLAKSLAVKIDDIVLDQNDTGMKGLLRESGTGGATATAGTAVFADIWPALVNAYSDVTSGVFNAPTAMVMHPRRWAWLASLRDADTRPLLSSLNPTNNVGGFEGLLNNGYGAGVRPTGSILGVPVYLDSRIPTNLGTGTDEDRIIVGKFDEAWLLESTPKFGISMDAEFLKDQAIIKVIEDVAFTCARQPSAFSIISGTALNDTI